MSIMSGYIQRLGMALVLVLVTAGSAFAQSGNMKNDPRFDIPTFMPESEFVDKTQLFKGDPNNDEALLYEVRLPKGWMIEKSTGAPGAEDLDSLNKNVLQRVARYVSPAQKHRRAMLSVESLELTYEVGAKNWFLNYLKSVGVTPEAIYPSENGDRQVEAFYIDLEGDISYGVHARAMINGPRVILIRYFVPIELFVQERAMQAQSIDSFTLTGKKVDQIEERFTHGFLHEAFFDYPASWVLSAPKVINVERMRAMVYTPGAGGKLAGQINIYLTSRFIETTLQEEVAQYRKKFALPDYTIGEKIETVAIKPHKDIEFARTEAYTLAPQKNFMLAYELWVTVMQSEGFYYILTMVTPAREVEFYQWARNVKAYEIVVGTTRQFDPNIDRYKYAE
jgi:hypothetical protein